MKLLKNLSLVSFLLLTQSGYSQEILQLDHNDDQDNNPGHVHNTAIEEVKLLPNYSFVGGSDTKMDAYLDPTIVAPANYGSLFSSNDFDSYDIDTDLAVGYTPGAHGVSPSGAATYTVPIQLPPGTNGMEPELAITYNSQAGNGLLGMGWNLAGLSSISRVPKTYYHDGAPDRIRFNNNDRFALDGNRLVSIGSGEYATEMETFSLITSHGSAGNGPQHFIVKTKEGMTIEYGKTEDSRFIVTSGGEALHWMINKMYDQHGNYIEYIYIQENNQIRIDKIRYTGNTVANIAPYNEIQFYYQLRNDLTEKYFGGSNLIKNNYLLSKIKVSSEELQYRLYEYKYAFEGLFSFLTEIQEKGKNNQIQFNKTIFEYEENVNNTPTPNSISKNGLPLTTPGSNVSNAPCGDNGWDIAYYPGDFNADGVTDLLGVRYWRNTSSDGGARYISWSLLINNNANGGGFSCYPLEFRPGWLGNDEEYSDFDPFAYFPVDGFTFHIADISGDGIDDIILGSKVHWDDDYKYYNAFIIKKTSNGYSYDQGIETLKFDDFTSGNTTKKHAVTIGDFDGDGILEFFGINLRTFDFRINSFNGRLSISQQIDNDATNITAGTAHAIDFEGDGVQSIDLNYTQSIARQRQILNFNIEPSSGSLQNFSFFQITNIELYPGAYASYILPHQYKPIDFNGDGNTDLIGKETQGYQTSYSIWYHQGNNVDQEYEEDLHYKKIDISSTMVEGDVFYQDVNSDGRTDIIKITSFNIYLYLSTGELGDFDVVSYPNTFIDLPDKKNYFFGDFTGDGNLELVHKYGFSTIDFLDLNPKSSTKDRRLKKVKNGFGQVTSFEYQTLAQTFHAHDGATGELLHGGPEDYPLRKIFGGFPIVNWVITENPISRDIKTSYEFYGGIAHLKGKGFLGFEKINTIVANPTFVPPNTPGENFQEQDRIYKEFELNNEHLIMLPSNMSVYAGAPEEGLNNFVTETSWTYNIIEQNNNRHWVRLETTESFNHVENIRSWEKYIYDNGGNITEHTVEIGEGSNLETTTTEYTNFFTIANNTWHVPSLPQKVETTSIRNNLPEIKEEREITYNPNGTIESETLRPQTDAWSQEVFTYGNNPFGLVESVTIKGLRPTEGGINLGTGEITSTEEITPIITDQYTYTPNGRNIATHTDRFGFTTEYSYYNRWGKIKTAIDHLGRQNYFEYDGFGRLQKEVDHLENVTTIKREFYENFSNEFIGCQSSSDLLYKRITKNETDNRESIKWFNKFGQERRHDVIDQYGTVRTMKCYDEFGRVIESRSPYYLGDEDYKTTIVTYDKFNRTKTSNTYPINSGVDYELLTSGGIRRISTSNAADTRLAETDATGRVVKRIDSNYGNTLTYHFISGGLLSMVKLNGEIITTNTYDSFGRQLSLFDGHASDMTLYQYDSFDNLIFQRDHKGNTIETFFDDFGRVERREVTAPGLNGDYFYEYYSSGHQASLLKKETAPGGNATSYTYDEIGNISSITETVDGVDYTTTFEYDASGRVSRKIFPESEFAIKYVYNDGYLQAITTDDGTPIWQMNNVDMDARGHVLKYSLGNGINVENTYDPEDYFLTTVEAKNEDLETILNFTYDFDPVSGNLTHRHLGSNPEWFEYDNNTGLKLHRLTGAGQDPDEMDFTYEYFPNGNLKTKDGVGSYSYDPILKHQVKKIDFEDGVDPNDPLVDLVGMQSINYNHFNGASTITNITNDFSVQLFYGPDDQRRKALYKNGETAIKTRFYIGAYEKQIDHANQNNEIKVHYISAMGQLVAIYVEDNSETETDEGLNGKMYYPHLDHLGSIIHITDASGDIVYTQSFDAWGRTRNPNDLSYDNIPERPDWLWRGYTGHEHLDEFGLINMNGRLYDPVVGRMLSPDNYVQNPNFSQSYNRYSYVWNNPLKYTDPSGEFVFIAPHISVNSSGNVDVGISVGVGFHQGLSAQVTVGHSFGNGGNTYATLSASAAGASAYVGYSSQGGFMYGAGFGIGPGMGFTTNATSLGIHWSQNGGVSANASVLNYNSYSGFSAHLSAGYSRGFEVGRNSRLNSTLSENPHYNDDPYIEACAICPGDPRKPPVPRAGLDKDVLGDGVRNNVSDRISDIEIGLGVVNSGIGAMQQAYRYDNQQYRYARNGYSANQLTQMNRANAIGMGRFFWNLGVAGSAFGIGYSGYQTFITGEASYGSFVYDVTMVGVAFIPYVGIPLSFAGTIFKPQIMHGISRIPRTDTPPHRDSYILK